MKKKTHRLLIPLFILLFFSSGITRAQDTGGPYTADANTILLMHFDGDLTNNSALSSDGVPSGNGLSYSSNAPSNLGQSLQIENSGSQNQSNVTVSTNNSLSLTGDWTIEMWFNLNSLNAGLVNKPTFGWESNYNIHVEAPDGHMEARFYDVNSTPYQINTPAGTIEPDNWYHVAFINSVSDNSITLIICDEDYVLIFEQSLSYPVSTVPATNDSDLTIGAGVDGLIDEFRISNVVRDYSYANVPPVVSGIPDQTISAGADFSTIILDDFITDSDDADSEITWTYGGNSDLSVVVDGNRVATVQVPDDQWIGSETITFTATDPEGDSDSDEATFTVVPPVVSDIPNQELIERKVSALNLHRMKYDTSPPFTVVIETLLPAEYEARKPAGALLFDTGFVDAAGKVFVSEPTTVEQQSVFSDLSQAALFYVCQSFLQYYYQTSEMPIWFKNGFASYEADMRPDDADIRTAYNNYGATLTSFDALNNPVTFEANNGFAVSFMFGEFMGVYKVWQYHTILSINASTLVTAPWWDNVESIEKLFAMWNRYVNIRILEENEQDRLKLNLETEHFRYYYRDTEAFMYPYFSDLLEEAITEYIDLLGIDIFEKFSFITMPECAFAELIEGTACIIRYASGTAWSSGMSATSPNNVDDFELFTDLYRHELAHLAYKHLPKGNNTAWLNEGFAHFMSRRPFTPEEVIDWQSVVGGAIEDATNYFGHLPTFEDTIVRPNPYFNFYILGQVMYNYIYEIGGYEAVRDVSINYDTGTANLGYSSPETFMAAYHFYLNMRLLKIGDPLTLTVLLPNGGENLTSGEATFVNWGYTDVPTIDIEYTVDNGASWSEIATGISSTNGTYRWTIPDINAAQCRVRVSDSANAAINDQSDGIFTVESPNVAPVVSNALSDLEMLVGGDAFVQDLSTVCTDADGDELSYSATSSDEAVASVTVENNSLTVTAVGTGSATITITASDDRGGTAEDTFNVTVGINTAPVVANAIADIELLVAEDAFIQNLSTVFSDNDGDELSYSATSSDEAVATVTVENNIMTVTAIATGTATSTITASDGRGGEASTSFVVNVPSGLAVERIDGEVPTEYALDQNYPNPFNPITTIQWALPEAGRVTLRIYNVQGVEIATLMDESFPPGRYSVSWDASGYASGVYMYRIEAGNYVETKALILLK